MLAQNDDQNELIVMLAWQLDMGIDEALLDQPQADAAPLRLDQLLVAAALQPPEAVKMANPALANSGAVPPEDKINTDSAALAGITSLADLQSGLAKLDNCPLKHTASNLCFADGNPGARLMIIGGAPGRDEDRMGVPFVGADGQLLDKMMASIGLDRASVYLTNLLPWRPPGNRSPTDEETAMLLPWLFRHVQLAKPEFVLLLGGAAAKLVLGSHDGIMKLRGRWRDVDFGDGVPRPVLASLHPAYLLRSPAQKRLAFEDLLLLAKRFAAVQLNEE
jgi:DNA polymerase